MSGIEGEVLKQFFGELAKNEKIADSVVEGLRPLLAAERLPSAAVLTELFTSESGGTSA